MSYKKTFTLRLSEELLNRLHYTAKSNKRSVNSEIEFIAEKYLKEFEKEHGSIPEVEAD